MKLIAPFGRWPSQRCFIASGLRTCAGRRYTCSGSTVFITLFVTRRFGSWRSFWRKAPASIARTAQTDDVKSVLASRQNPHASSVCSPELRQPLSVFCMWRRIARRKGREYGDGDLFGGEVRLRTAVAAEERVLQQQRSRALDRLVFGGFRSLFVHEWNVVGREDSRDVADHDGCNAFNGLLSLVVYPRNDRRARLRRVVIRSVVAGKAAGVAVPTRATRNSQTKGPVAQKWDAVYEILVGPGSNRLAGGVQLDPTSDVIH